MRKKERVCSKWESQLLREERQMRTTRHVERQPDDHAKCKSKEHDRRTEAEGSKGQVGCRFYFVFMKREDKKVLRGSHMVEDCAIDDGSKVCVVEGLRGGGVHKKNGNKHKKTDARGVYRKRVVTR